MKAKHEQEIKVLLDIYLSITILFFCQKWWVETFQAIWKLAKETKGAYKNDKFLAGIREIVRMYAFI